MDSWGVIYQRIKYKWQTYQTVNEEKRKLSDWFSLADIEKKVSYTLGLILSLKKLSRDQLNIKYIII